MFLFLGTIIRSIAQSQTDCMEEMPFKKAYASHLEKLND